MKKHYRIALVGNPNCGKSCIFNVLTGARQHVGNYPGVTVERRSGTFVLDDAKIELIDLPGVYSLSSSSPEEEITFQELIRPGVDIIINVADSTIPRRSLYLTIQLAELRIPMIIALNMSDEAAKKGLTYDVSWLEHYFGTPVVQTVGCRGDGVSQLLSRLAGILAGAEESGMPLFSFGRDVDEAIAAVADRIGELKIDRWSHIPPRFFAIKLLENDTAVRRMEEFGPAWTEVEAQTRRLWDRHAIESDTFMADRRYAMLAGVCRDAVSAGGTRRREISDRIDMIMTNKYFGLPLFFLIIYITFWFTFTCADPLMGYIEDFFSRLSDSVKAIWHPETLPFLRSMLTDGVIGGVGGVIVFLPNILFLFFAIAILEDSGYMARAAFVMDGVMRKFGLQGRSFVPLVLGFGCSVPAIMATRTIESERDRTVTIMILPLMSCGARLPIYALIIPAFFAARYQAFVMWLIYLIGAVIALIAARVMKSTLFKGEGEVYLMELPPYRLPTLRSLMLHMWDRGRMYLQKAGTIILATSIVLFICNTFPEKEFFSRPYDAEIAQLRQANALTEAQLAVLAGGNLFDDHALARIRTEREIPAEILDALDETKLSAAQRPIVEAARELKDGISRLENEKQAEQMEYTISGRVGHALEPFFRPIGFDWKLTTASIGALAAKEVFVSQLGILYAEGETDEESVPLRERLAENYTPLQGFCIMLFCLLSIPCLATLAIIRRELNSWKMVFAEAGGLFALAYLMTMTVYQLGMLFNVGTRIAG